MKKITILVYVLTILFAFFGTLGTFYSLMLVPENPTDLQLACFGLGFSFWPMILGYLGILDILGLPKKCNVAQQPASSAPNIDSEDQQLPGPTE